MVFAKSYCPHCKKAKALLTDGGVPFKAIDMDTVPGGEELHAALKQYSGQTSVPNVYVAGKHIGGNDDIHAFVASG